MASQDRIVDEAEDAAGLGGARRGGVDGKTKVKEVEWKAETYWHLSRAGGWRGKREGE